LGLLVEHRQSAPPFGVWFERSRCSRRPGSPPRSGGRSWPTLRRAIAV